MMEFMTDGDYGFCYKSEQGTHGEVKQEWFPEWEQFIPVCRLHSHEPEE